MKRGKKYLALFHKKQVSKKYTTLLFPIIGTGIQIFSWILFFPIGVMAHRYNLLAIIMNVLSFIWFFIPLLSIYGLYVAYLQRGKKFGVIPIIGFIINGVWFLLFLVIFIGTFSGFLSV